MEREINLHAGNTSKLEYSANGSSNWTRMYGLLSIPDIGGEPNKIDTTCLDNEEYETFIYGLKPAVELGYEFNMEDPSSTANFKVASDMETAGTSYYWRITYANGVTVSYKSKVKLDIKATNSGDLLKFGMYHAPEGEPTIDVPTTSA